MYQNHEANYYTREKRYLEDHAVHIVDRIIACFEERYDNLFNTDNLPSVNVNSDTGDRVLFDVCRVLNCNVWQAGDSDFEEDGAYSIQINSQSAIFNRYTDILKPFTEDEVKNSFLANVHFGLKYFNMVNVDPLEFWWKILSLEDEHPHWRPALLVLEICVRVPYSSATLERLFSQMNLIKTLLRNRLNNASLNAILRVRINGISLQQFHDNFVNRCVNRWYNSVSIVCQ